MTVEMDDTDKLKILFDDATDMGIGFEHPDINTGEYEFKPVSKNTIRYGLGAVKGTGKAAIEAICEDRSINGRFSSLFDFCVRIDRSRINRRTVEALIKAGAFDCVWNNRAELLASVGLAFEFAQSQENNSNQGGLFDAVDEHGSGTSAPDMVMHAPWGGREQLTFEKSALGFHLSGHLFDEAEAEVRKFVKTRLSELTESRDPQWAAGIVRSERSIPTAKGKLNIFVLDDGSCSLEITADEAVFTRLRPLLREDQLVICLLKVQNDRRSGGLRMSLSDALDLSSARCRFGKYLKITLAEQDCAQPVLCNQLVSSIRQSAQTNLSDGLPVRLHLLLAETEVDLQLGEKAHIHPSDEVLSALSELLPVNDSMIVYE